MTQPATVRDGVGVSEIGWRRAVAIRRLAVRIAGAVRHYPERLLHPRRRAAARRQLLLQANGIRTALFICHGNVCRSPFAAAFFERSARQVGLSGIAVASAGFIGPDRPPPPRALAAAARRDLDLAAHRSSLVSKARVDHADLLVVVAAEQARALRRRFGAPRGLVLVLGDLDPDATIRRTIRDPWGGDDAAFDDSYARVVRCVAELVQILASARVRDPARSMAPR